MVRSYGLCRPRCRRPYVTATWQRLSGYWMMARTSRTRVQGYTPLHFAVLHEFAAVALELVRRGADVRARDPTGEDPLMLTALSNRISDTDAARVARALLARGADVHGTHGKDAIPRVGQYTPLYVAENRNKEMLAVVLREFGAALSPRNLRPTGRGLTPRGGPNSR